MSAAAPISVDPCIGTRLVEAADEVRRQLERDLHDGAQQQLVLASLTLGRAAAEARGTAVELLVVEALDLVQQGLVELRELARGLHPAGLREQGLARALEGLAARTPLPVELHVTSQRLPHVVETAIYFTVAEALTNIAKHAAASSATVAVEVGDGSLVAVIADDGVGGARADEGSGLRGLGDRLGALGGTLEVDSPNGRGTTLRARVPLNPAPAARRAAGSQPRALRTCRGADDRT